MMRWTPWASVRTKMTHNLCTRRGCGGTVIELLDGSAVCTLCARTAVAARPPTAEESAGERVRNVDKLFRRDWKRRRVAAARKAAQHSLDAPGATQRRV